MDDELTPEQYEDGDVYQRTSHGGVVWGQGYGMNCTMHRTKEKALYAYWDSPVGKLRKANLLLEKREKHIAELQQRQQTASRNAGHYADQCSKLEEKNLELRLALKALLREVTGDNDEMGLLDCLDGYYTPWPSMPAVLKQVNEALAEEVSDA